MHDRRTTWILGALVFVSFGVAAVAMARALGGLGERVVSLERVARDPVRTAAPRPAAPEGERLAQRLDDAERALEDLRLARDPAPAEAEGRGDPVEGIEERVRKEIAAAWAERDRCDQERAAEVRRELEGRLRENFLAEIRRQVGTTPAQEEDLRAIVRREWATGSASEPAPKPDRVTLQRIDAQVVALLAPEHRAAWIRWRARRGDAALACLR